MPITMFFQIFLSSEQQTRLKKMRSKFIEWNEKFTKMMVEHMKKIKSLSPPRLSSASQSLPITPTPPVATVTKKRKKELLK
jgi:hypothetical protein